MGLDGFETRLLTADVAALARFYRGLGFEEADQAEGADVVRLARGDCRLALVAAADGAAGQTELAFGQGDIAMLQRDAGGDVVNGVLRLVDPDGSALLVGVGPQGVAAAPDPVLGWYEPSLAVANIARTAGFYGRLGFEAADGDIAQRNVTLQQGDCRLCLYQGYLDPAVTQLIFWQGEVATVAGLAEGAGLKVRSPLERNAEGHISLMLEDPDARPLYFIFIPGVARRAPAEEAP